MWKVNNRYSSWLLRRVEVSSNTLFNIKCTTEMVLAKQEDKILVVSKKKKIIIKNNNFLFSSDRDGSNPREIKSSDTDVLKSIHPSNTITEKFSEFSQLFGAQFNMDARNSCSMARKRGGKQNHVSFCAYSETWWPRPRRGAKTAAALWVSLAWSGTWASLIRTALKGLSRQAARSIFWSSHRNTHTARLPAAAENSPQRKKKERKQTKKINKKHTTWSA